MLTELALHVDCLMTISVLFTHIFSPYDHMVDMVSIDFLRFKFHIKIHRTIFTQLLIKLINLT